MGDSSLSQEEIDALLMGAEDSADLGGFGSSPGGAGSAGGLSLSPSEEDALGDLLGTSFDTAGSSLSTFLDSREVSIHFVKVDVKSGDQVKNDFSASYVGVTIPFVSGFSGGNLFVFHQKDAIAIANVLMGGNGSNAPDEMDDGLLQTFLEPLNILISSMATQMGNKISQSIQTGPPDSTLIASPADVVLPSGTNFAKITYSLSIANLINSQFFHILNFDTASDIASAALGKGRAAAKLAPGAGIQMDQESSVPRVAINPVRLPTFVPVGDHTDVKSIDLLLDVPMMLTVELGRAKMSIKEILTLSEGSIIELDKLAGEPVDLLVNGKLIGKGEVVVIDENFGVRVTDIVSPHERAKQFE